MKDREGGDRVFVQQDVDNRGDYRVGPKLRETGEVKVKLLQENTVLPMRGSEKAVGYDLCGANSYVIPTQSICTMETELAVSLPPGTYTRIAPRSGFAIRNFVNVVAVYCWGKIKVALFDCSTKDLQIQRFASTIPIAAMRIISHFAKCVL